MNPARGERGELLACAGGGRGLRASALPLFPEVADDDADRTAARAGDRDDGRPGERPALSRLVFEVALPRGRRPHASIT